MKNQPTASQPMDPVEAGLIRFAEELGTLVGAELYRRTTESEGEQDAGSSKDSQSREG